MDPSGKVCIEPTFDHATEFHEGLAFVWSFPGYEEDRSNVPLGEDYISYERFNLNGNRLTGIIDSTGKYVIEPRVNFEFFSHFENGVALVEIDNDIVFIDKKGYVLNSFDPVLKEKRMKEVRRVAQYGQELPRRYCYVDASRTAVLGPFNETLPFSEGLAAVRLGEHFGYIDRDGDMKVVPQFKKAGYFKGGYATVGMTAEVEGVKKTLFGVIDTTGRFVIPAIYDYLDEPSQGFVTAGIGDFNHVKYGLLDMSGEIVIPFKYNGMGQYSEGLIPVMTKKKYGYMDLQQHMKIKPRYEFVRPFRNGAAYVRISEGKSTIINTKGTVLWDSFDKGNCRN